MNSEELQKLGEEIVEALCLEPKISRNSRPTNHLPKNWQGNLLFKTYNGVKTTGKVGEIVKNIVEKHLAKGSEYDTIP